MRALKLFVMTAFVALLPSTLYAADTNTTNGTENGGK